MMFDEKGKPFSSKTLPVSNESIPCQEDVNRWPQLTGIFIQEIDAHVGLLKGQDAPQAFEPREKIEDGRRAIRDEN